MSPARKKKAPSKPKQVAPKSKAGRPAPKLAVAPAHVNVLVWLRAKKGKEAPLERELRTLASASRTEPGCLEFAMHSSADHAGNFFLHEIWAAEASLAAHRQTPHFQRWLGLQPAILESRRRFIAE